MKRITKHLMTLLLSVVMVLAMGLIVFAEGKTYSLTLTETATNHTYEVYQIFTGDLSAKEDGTKVLSNVQWGKGVSYSGEGTASEVATKLSAPENDSNRMTLDQLLNKLTLTKPVKTVTSAKDSTVIDGLSAGYYLVKDKDGSQANTSDAYTKFIVQVVGDTTSQVKSDVPTVVKKVKDTNDSQGTTSDWQDSADADINDDVQYRITGTMPSTIGDYTTYKYVFTDTMSKGLTYTDNNAKITIGDKDVTSSFNETVTTKEDGSTVVTWTCDDLKGINGVTLTEDTTVVVTYSAKLNEKAIIGAAGNPNTVDLTYSNNPNNGGEGDTGKTPEDKNIVFTYKTVVNKVDQDKKSLKGASFKLEKKLSDGSYKTVKEFTAGEETKFEFSGLDDGEYKLTETTTPAGYNTIAPIGFTISAEHDADSADPKLISLSGNVTSGEAKFTADKDAGSLTTDVVNKKGSTLPSTGGRGTTMIYIIGAALVVLAGVGLVMRKKMSSKES